MTLTEFLRNLERAKLSEAVLKVIEDNELKAVELNTEDQLYDKGILANGKSVGEYSNFTKQIKQGKGQRYDHITLRDTSNFHDSFYVDADKWPVLFGARDWKESMLVERYGEDIFGLTKSNTDVFGKAILPEVQDAFKKELGL